jgi:hypothetical protein
VTAKATLEDEILELLQEQDFMVHEAPNVDESFIYKLMSSALSVGPILDMGQSSWSMEEVEAAWRHYKATASAAYRSQSGYAPPEAPQAVLDYHERLRNVTANVVSAEVLPLDIPPIAREELEQRITFMGRERKNPRAAKELKMALKKGGPKLRVSPETAAFIYEELLDAKKILQSPSMASDPFFQYQLVAIKQAIKNMGGVSASKGPASATLAMVEEVKDRLLSGSALDLSEVQALVEAAVNVLQAKSGKCPEDGCAVKRGGKWRVMSNKTGKLWPQEYDTKEDAQGAIAAYHMRKKGIPPA